MIRWLARLLQFTVCLLLIASPWLLWWRFGDLPLKVVKPDPPVSSFAPTIGLKCRTAVEKGWSNVDPGNLNLRALYWRSLESGRCIVSPQELLGYRFRLTNDENTLVALKTHQPVRLWDRETGKCRAELPAIGLTESFDDVANSPIDRTLVYATNEGSVLVVDIPSGRVRHTLAKMRGPVAVSDDGNVVACFDDEKRLVIQNCESGQSAERLDCAKLEGARVMFLDEHGQRILVVYWDDTAAKFEYWQDFGNQRHSLMSAPISSPFWPQSWITHNSGLLILGPMSARRLWQINHFPPVEITSSLPNYYSDALSTDGKLLAISKLANSDLSWQFFSTAGMAKKEFTLRSSGQDFLMSSFGEYAAIKEPEEGARYVVNSLLYNVGAIESMPGQNWRIINTDTGAFGRLLSASKYCKLAFAPDNQSVWISNTIWDSAIEPRGVIYTQWPLTKPKSPWWLWIFSGVGILLVFQPLIRRAFCSRKPKAGFA